MIYEQAKPFLLKLPVFQEVNAPYFIKELAKVLKSSVYLPNDYIVYKDDLGEEMYFIVAGRVNVLSPNETQVIATLGKGNYFGEIALFMPNSRRICSVVADTYSELYILDKKSLDEITKRFPSLSEHFRKEGERRLNDYQSKQNIIASAKQEKFAPDKNFIIKEEADDHEKSEAEEEKYEFDEIDKLLQNSEGPFSPTNRNRFGKEPDINLKEIFSGRSFLNGFDMMKLRLRIFNGEEIESILKFNTGGSYGFNEYVENDEFNPEIKRQSRRVKCHKNKERRYSRVTLGQELILSKFSGLSMQWGINNI